MPSTNAKTPEESKSPEKQPAPEAEPGAADDESGSESDGEVPAATPSESGPSRPTSKKKKKKRSKVARVIDALKGDSVPQAVVDQVVAKVKEEHGENSAAADEETVREVLRQLKLKDVAEGKAGFGGKNRKDTGDHKVFFLFLSSRFRLVLTCLGGIVLGDAACSSLWYVPIHPVNDLGSLILSQTMGPQMKMGTSKLPNPEKRSGKTRSHSLRTLSGLSSTYWIPPRFETDPSHF